MTRCGTLPPVDSYLPAEDRLRDRTLARFATMRVIRLSILIAVAAALLLLPRETRGGAAHQVSIVDFAFSPATITISIGDSVTWTNEDPVIHDATSTSGAFDSGDLDQGESYTLTFSQPGTHDYLCTPHPQMTGSVVVQAAAASPGGGGTVPDVAMDGPGLRDSGMLRALLAIATVLLVAATALLLVIRTRRSV